MQRCKAFEKEFHDCAEELARRCCVEKDSFHGGSFDGNVCHRLLQNTDSLRSICPLSALQYAECFVFHHIVDFCKPRREVKLQELKCQDGRVWLAGVNKQVNLFILISKHMEQI